MTYRILAVIVGAPEADAQRLADLLRSPEMSDLRAMIFDITPPEWWHSLRTRTVASTEGTYDRVTPVRDGITVYRGTGEAWGVFTRLTPDGKPRQWDIWAVDQAKRRLYILDERRGYPGGLYVAPEDVDKS
mgnify:CR=1 FL=1